MEFLSLMSIGGIILILVVAIRSIKLHDKIRNLEWQIQQLNSLMDRVNKIEIELSKLKPAETRAKQPDTAVPSKPLETIPVPVQQPSLLSAADTSEIKRTRPLAEQEPSRSRTREEWESFIGGKLLNRIGALALIIGLGFFMKYAFDNNWISETIRVVIGACVGFLCVGLAYRTSKKGFQIFAQGLIGAGIAILYLSVYASFNYYALVPQWTAFLFMSLVTALSLLLGIYFNSLAIGILGWAGGFLTPIMLSTGSANEIGLFTYIALLDVGLLAVVFAKQEWRVLEPLTLAGTWIMYFVWYFEYYHESDLLITVFFISIFWLLFFGLDIARLRLLTPSGSVLHHGVAVLNAILFYGILYSLMNADYHNWTGGITLVVGGIYFVIFLWLKHAGVTSQTIAMRYTLSAVVLSVLATSIQFEDFTTVLFWSLEATALVWCGVHWKQRFISLSATVLFAAASFKFLATEGALASNDIEHFKIFFNQRCLTLIVLTLSSGLCAWLIKKIEADNKFLSSLFHTAWPLFLFILSTVEMNDFFRSKMFSQPLDVLERLRFIRILVFAIVWGFLSVPIIWFAVRKKIVPVLISGICLLALGTCCTAVRGFTFEPISIFQPIINFRTGVILFMVGILYLQQRMLTHQTLIAWVPGIVSGIQICMVMLPLILLSGETIDYFEQLILSTLREQRELDRLNNLRQLSLSGVWLLYSVALMVLGFWRSMRSIRIIAFVLFGITILKIFIYDLSYLETLYRIISFIGLGLILLAVSYAYQQYKHIIFGSGERME
jgi:uncharacterized membrane protein